MKKINKMLLIASAVCGGAGILLLLIGIFMGVTWEQIQDAVLVTAEDTSFWIEKGNENWSDAMELLEEEKAETFSGIRDLQLTMRGGYFDLETYEGDKIKVVLNEKDNQTEVVQDGRELKIVQKPIRILGNDLEKIEKKHPIKILIPEKYLFDSVKMHMGAAEGICGAIRTSELDVEIDVGSLEMNEIVQATESSFSADAGEIRVEELQSRETDMECNAGEISITMNGKKEDYRMKGEVNVGTVWYGGEEWDNISQDFQWESEKAKNKIDISCNVGDVTVDFLE